MNYATQATGQMFESFLAVAAAVSSICWMVVGVVGPAIGIA